MPDRAGKAKTGAEMVLLGRITGAYGIKGWVKVYSYTQPMQAIADYDTWYLRPPGGEAWRPVRLKQGKRHAKTVVAQLEACDDRNQAESLAGQEIAIRAEQLPALEAEDEFYWRDLIGLRVINAEDVELGVVEGLMETGANDVLVVVTHIDGRRRERLIPWIFGQAIVAVDTGAGVIRVDWPEAWCD